MADDHRAICELKYRYTRTLDTKAWDGFADTMVPEVTADYGGLAFDNRESLVAYMKENLGPGRISLHQVHHPEITVEGDVATGRWYLQDKVIIPEFQFYLEGASMYGDRYVRTSDGWRIAHTEYERVYELTANLADFPSLKVTGPAGIS